MVDLVTLLYRVHLRCEYCLSRRKGTRRRIRRRRRYGERRTGGLWRYRERIDLRGNCCQFCSEHLADLSSAVKGTPSRTLCAVVAPSAPSTSKRRVRCPRNLKRISTEMEENGLSSLVLTFQSAPHAVSLLPRCAATTGLRRRSGGRPRECTDIRVGVKGSPRPSSS